MNTTRRYVLAVLLASSAAVVAGQQAPSLQPFTSAPDRRPGEGEGPFDRLIIRGVTVIDGTGAPAQGPADVVIARNRIEEVRFVGVPHVSIRAEQRPAPGTREIDGTGMFLLPGFVDLHTHTGGEQAPEAEYIYKLWLAHGVTTVRGVPFGPIEWSLRERERSRRNEIVAPRLFSYHVPFTSDFWDAAAPQTPEAARAWVRMAAAKGIDGLKLMAFDPEVMEALLDEARKYNLGSTAHLGQTGVARMNARDASRLGLGAMTHFYGLFEALLRDSSVQAYPLTHNYADEEQRFAQVARLWDRIHPRGSVAWNELIEEWVARRFIIDPTMTVYVANRDLMRARTAEWHDKYTHPALWAFFQPSREAHGSYHLAWTTEDEVAWRNFFHVWMSFLNDFKNKGGRVTTGSDAGFIYETYGFGYVQELELLQEAGFHPLEVIRAATLHGAQALHEPQGKPIEFGIVRPGLLADLVLVDRNPLEDLKVLYGTGTLRLDASTGRMERVGGVRYTIKDGIVYDARALLADVAGMVARARGIWRSSTSAP